MSTSEKSGRESFDQTPSADVLRTGELAAALRDTSASYKFFWLLALVDLLQALDRPVPIGRVVEAMIVRAWAPVALFRLSLGKADRLQDCVRSFQSDRNLPARSASKRLHAELERWPGLPMWADELARFVPGRFLGAWFPDVARARPYDRRGARDVATTAASAWGTDDSGPYRLIDNCGDAEIELAPGWRDWLQRNRALVLGFTEQRLSLYLQARNPDVPGIVSKLEIPARRSLAHERAWWRWAMSQSDSEPVRDIYTGSELGNDFQVDHFLPWSFVAHDAFWNLCPVVPGVNRAKSDAIPALDEYLVRLAAIHAALIARDDLPSGLAHSYAMFLGLEPAALRDVTAAFVQRRYEQVVRPLAQIAENQGFPAGWRSVNDRERPR